MRRFRWLIWAFFLLAWTAALVYPDPAPFLHTAPWIGLRPFVAKGMHVGCYALFAILSGWLRVPMRYRPLLMFVMMAHATATEIIQLEVSHRTGQLSDVAIDNAAILLGYIVSLPWWLERDESAACGLAGHDDSQPR